MTSRILKHEKEMSNYINLSIKIDNEGVIKNTLKQIGSIRKCVEYAEYSETHMLGCHDNEKEVVVGWLSVSTRSPHLHPPPHPHPPVQEAINAPTSRFLYFIFKKALKVFDVINVYEVCLFVYVYVLSFMFCSGMF